MISINQAVDLGGFSLFMVAAIFSVPLNVNWIGTLALILFALAFGVSLVSSLEAVTEVMWSQMRTGGAYVAACAVMLALASVALALIEG